MPNIASDTTPSAADTDTDPGDSCRHLVACITIPVPEDGADVHDLIAACPPLDTNSLYMNLIQCSHFAQTCALARRDGEAIGWMSGHEMPGDPETFFLWQVAVHEKGRGQRLAHRMLAEILARPRAKPFRSLRTTITPDNAASWGLFRSIARALDAPLAPQDGFDRARHFRGRHDSERLVTIGPFRRPCGLSEQPMAG